MTDAQRERFRRVYRELQELGHLCSLADHREIMELVLDGKRPTRRPVARVARPSHKGRTRGRWFGP